MRQLKLYQELADWWPAFSDPADYRREAAHFGRAIRRASRRVPRTLLELGSGGGTSATFLKKRFAMTLVDISPRMVKVSRARNPECEHIRGDIRRIRLGRTFDAVFTHDAIAHMLDEADLQAVMETAYAHLRPGGVALFVPDFVRETFTSGTDQGGHDFEGRTVRFLQWVFDPDPADTRYVVDFAIMLRTRNGRVRVVHDRHSLGLFPRARWLELLRRVGFRPAILRHSVIREAFIGHRPVRST